MIRVNGVWVGLKGKEELGMGEGREVYRRGEWDGYEKLVLDK